MNKFIVLVALLLAPLCGFASDQQALSVGISRDQLLNYSFGLVQLNQRISVDFTLTATGDEPSELKQFAISGMYYDGVTNCPRVIPAGQSCTVRIFYWPQTQGPHWGDAYLVMKDGTIQIRLFGDTFR